MRNKRIFTLLIAYVLIFSMTIPVSAAENLAINENVVENVTENMEIKDEAGMDVEIEKVDESEIFALLNTENESQNSDAVSVSGSDVTEQDKEVDENIADVSGGDKQSEEVPVKVKLPNYDAGNSMAGATQIYAGNTYYGNISSANTVDWYKFTVGASGKIIINTTAYITSMYYRLYDSAGTQMWYDTSYYNDVTGMSNESYSFFLNQGTYYFMVEKRNSNYGDYCFSLGYTNAYESFAEPTYGNNNELRTANSISLGQEYRGLISYDDGKDCYKFTLNSSSALYINLSAEMKKLYWYLYDADGNELAYSHLYYNSTTGIITENDDLDLKSGTYYFVIKESSGTGVYNFKLTGVSANESFVESKTVTNNSLATANTISTGVTYKGQIALNDNKDFYKFKINSASKVMLTAKAYMKRVYYTLFDANGKELWSTYEKWNDVSYESNMSDSLDLSAGTYYFVVERYSTDSVDTGAYSFSVSIHKHKYKKVTTKATATSNGSIETRCSCGKVKSSKIIYALSNIQLSKTSYTYDGKVKKPSVIVKNSQGKRISSSNYTVTYSKGRKNIGKYTVTIKFKGNYKGTVKKTFYIYPKKIGITKLISNKRGFTVRFKKTPKQASGYQVQYSTSSGFWWYSTKTIKSGSKSAAKITGLSSNRTYYVRVRAYKKVGNTTYYSAWGSAKSVKTR